MGQLAGSSVQIYMEVVKSGDKYKLQGVRGDNGWKGVLDVLPVRTIISGSGGLVRFLQSCK